MVYSGQATLHLLRILYWAKVTTDFLASFFHQLPMHVQRLTEGTKTPNADRHPPQGLLTWFRNHISQNDLGPSQIMSAGQHLKLLLACLCEVKHAKAIMPVKAQQEYIIIKMPFTATAYFSPLTEMRCNITRTFGRAEFILGLLLLL